MFNQLFIQPLFNLLIVIYNVLPYHDLGIAIIILTVIVKAILFPFSWKQLKAQQMMQDIQPRIEELKAQYKDDKAGLQAAQVKFFQEEKINPFATCLPLLIQFPFLIAIYRLFIVGFTPEHLSSQLYPFVYNPVTLNQHFFGLSLVDKAGSHPLLSVEFAVLIILPVLAGLAQFWQAKMMFVKRPPKVAGAQDEDFAAIMNQQMLFLMPILTIVFGAQFAVGLSLYWLVNTLLSIAQQKYFLKNHTPKISRGAGAVVATQ